MQLHLNATSPFARVARIVALEKGIELELCWSDPWSDQAELLAVNPLARVPVLVCDDGESIGESLLIALHLDSLSSRTPLLPAARQAAVLHLAGQGIGLMEAAFNRVIARKHEGAAAEQSLLGQRRLRAIERTLAALEGDWPARASEQISLGDIVIAVALDYLAFRLPELDWPARFPALRQCHARLAARKSFSSTVFS